MFKEKNIKKWIVSLPIFGVLCTSIILVSLFINQTKLNYSNDIHTLENIYISHAKQLAKDRINNTINIINQKEIIFQNLPQDVYKQKIQNLLNAIAFENNGYIFAYDLKGNTISHTKKSLVGSNRWLLKSKGQFAVQDIIKYGQKKEGHFMQYTATLNPNTHLPAKKISYIKKLDHLDWIIGTGIYVDDLHMLVKEKEKKLNYELEQTIKNTVIISTVITILGIGIMIFLSNNIFNIIQRYRKILAYKNATLEEQVKERTKEQDTLLSLFNQADTVLFKWDYKTSNLMYVSKSISRILGYKEEELLNHSIKYKNCIHPEDFESYKMQYQTAVRQQRQYYEHTPYRIITQDNKIKWIHDYTLFVKNDKGEIVSLVGYITDITLLKEHDKVMFQQAKMASLGEMIGNIAHQWRQPLSTITTAASGLKLHRELKILTNESFLESINAIMRNSNYLSETIDDFKNYIKNNREQENFLLKNIINKNLLLLEGNIKTNHITIIKDFDNEIELFGRHHDLIQVTMNIINNAIDLLKTKSMNDEKLIFITTQQLSNSISLQIKDNAGGIPEDIMDRIFEPYFTTKHQSQGTGLGLYMSHNIINNMGGEIFITNLDYLHNDTQYTGALFTIELPLS